MDSTLSFPYELFRCMPSPYQDVFFGMWLGFFLIFPLMGRRQEFLKILDFVIRGEPVNVGKLWN